MAYTPHHPVKPLRGACTPCRPQRLRNTIHGVSGQPLRLHLLAAACAALPLWSAAAWAQSTPAEGQLQQITVTAERRTENIRDVPSSISTLRGDIIEALGTSGQDVRALSGRVPSLNIESSFGRAFPRFYIRGYGNTDFRLNASQPVSLVYDDVVQENPILKGFPVFDVEGVEVLRGPQGTLFGRNTPAGVVKFDSVKPGKKTDGYGSISAGTFNTINLEGAGTIALGQDLALRISVLNLTRSDWVTNTVANAPTQKLEGYRDSALRLQLGYGSGTDLSVLANLHGRDYKGSARLFRANIIKPGTNEFVDGFDERKISTDGINQADLQNVGGSLRVRVGLQGMALHSITGYEHVKTLSRGDIDGGFGASFLPSSGPGVIPFASESADGMPKHSQLTQEFRLESTTAGPLSWQAGLYFFREDYKIESFSYDSLGANAQDGYLRVRQKNNAAAVFGNINYSLTPQFKLRAGLRYTRDSKTFAVEDYNASGFAPCVGPTIGAIPVPPKCTLAQLAAQGPLTASPRDNKLNWDLSGTYALNKDTTVYARAATGFRGSSVQGASAFNNQSVAGPESNTSVEAGVKADLFNRRSRVSFSVFSYTVKDLQLTAVGGAANANILLSAKKAVGQGFELDLQSILTDQVVATLGVGYNDTKIRDSNLAVAYCASCTVTDPKRGSSTGPALIDGNPLPQAPKLTTNFTLKFTQPMAALGGGDFYVFTDWVYRSKVNFFLYESPEFTGKSMTEGGLRMGYSWGNGKYDLAVFGRNITNQIRIVGGIDFNNLTGFINEPRTFGAQFKATF
jgi:iron complex outermembrane recepter protein